MRRGKRKRIWPWAILLLVGFLTMMAVRFNPVTEELARAKISDQASNVINAAVNRQITDGNIQYRDLITLERDQTGAIAALTTNMQEMNRLKTQLLTRLDTELAALDADELSIPVGNLTGLQLLSGRGPDIPVRVVAVSSSDASFSGEFADAGINQTIHRIMLNVAVELVILLPSGISTERVSTDVCVAETVLLGPVPSSYTNFSGIPESEAAKYMTSK